MIQIPPQNAIVEHRKLMGWAFPTLLVTLAIVCQHAQCAARLGDERIIFQTRFGNLELALYPEVHLISCDIQADL